MAEDSKTGVSLGIPEKVPKDAYLYVILMKSSRESEILISMGSDDYSKVNPVLERFLLNRLYDIPNKEIREEAVARYEDEVSKIDKSLSNADKARKQYFILNGTLKAAITDYLDKYWGLETSLKVGIGGYAFYLDPSYKKEEEAEDEKRWLRAS